jgi:hypothetical protein
MKIYDKDPRVPYQHTDISALMSKAKVEGILAEYGISDHGWHWRPEEDGIFLMFQLEDTINGRKAYNTVKIEAPQIWHKGPQKKEVLNWNVSMRVLYWYVKSHLEAAYLMGKSRTSELLPNVVLKLPDGSEKMLGEYLAVSGTELSSMAKALPFREVPPQ